MAQVVGGLLGAGVIFLIASGAPGFDVHAGFASNGFGMQSGRLLVDVGCDTGSTVAAERKLWVATQHFT